MSKIWKNDLTDPPVGSQKGLAGRLWEALTNHLYQIQGAKTVWVDVDFPLITRTTGTNRPTLATFNTNFEMLQWAVNDNLPVENQEMIHGWKEGTEVFWHVHMVTGGTNVNARYVKWKIDYCYANVGSTYNGIQTVQAEILIPANTPAFSNILCSIGSFTDPNLRIGAHVKAKVTRIAATGTAPTANPFLDMCQIHVQCDSVGSGSIAAK